MAARPFHVGHDALIRLAAGECDEVRVLASAFTDRECVRASTMRDVWNRCIVPNLPPNVIVTMTHVPVRTAYEALGLENELADPAGPSFALYGDEKDVISSFPDKHIERYMGNLLRQGRVTRRPVPRSSTVDIDGTHMREWLAAGDERSFCAGLPDWMDKRTVWRMLRSDVE